MVTMESTGEISISILIERAINKQILKEPWKKANKWNKLNLNNLLTKIALIKWTRKICNLLQTMIFYNKFSCQIEDLVNDLNLIC